MKSIIIFLENQAHFRENIKIGAKVSITKKEDQRTNKQTYGQVAKILTSKNKHTRGIKVRLTNGTVGRVTKIIEEK